MEDGYKAEHNVQFLWQNEPLQSAASLDFFLGVKDALNRREAGVVALEFRAEVVSEGRNFVPPQNMFKA